MKRLFIIIVSVVVALMMLVTSLIISGCGSAPKHRITMDNELRSKLIVRGQSFKKPTKYEKTTFTWPLKGPVMSLFGIRHGRRHDGIDISAPRGTPIYAAADGEVVFSGTMRGYGNLILVRHWSDYYTAYSHNSANLADEGKKVRQGDVIAEVGRTGRATGNHLHFEIRRGQEAVDPMGFLPAVEGVYVKKSAVDKDRYASRSLKKGSKYAKKDAATSAKGKKDLSDKKRGSSKDKLAKKGAAASKGASTAGGNGAAKDDGTVALKKGPVKAGALANGKTLTKKSKAATTADAAEAGTKVAKRMGVMPKETVAPASAKAATKVTGKSGVAPIAMEGDLVAPSDTVADALGVAKPEAASATSAAKSSSAKTPVKIAGKEGTKGTAKVAAKTTTKTTKTAATAASTKSKATPATNVATNATPAKKTTTMVATKKTASTAKTPATKKAGTTVAAKKKTPAVSAKVARVATPKKTATGAKPIVMKETGAVKKASPQ